jgi:2-phosphoglycerate kinase
MNKKVDIITKASGMQVPFSVKKLRTSLQRSGANNDLIVSIITEVKKQLYPGITTKKIYKLAHALLKKVSKPTAARYT